MGVSGATAGVTVDATAGETATTAGRSLVAVASGEGKQARLPRWRIPLPVRREPPTRVPTAGHARAGAHSSLGHGVPSQIWRRGRLGRVRCGRRSYGPAPLADLRSGARSIDRPRSRSISTIGRRRRATRRARRRGLLGNRGSLPSNAAAHVACWRCVPVVPGRGGMCGVPAATGRRLPEHRPLNFGAPRLHGCRAPPEGPKVHFPGGRRGRRASTKAATSSKRGGAPKLRRPRHLLVLVEDNRRPEMWVIRRTSARGQ